MNKEQSQLSISVNVFPNSTLIHDSISGGGINATVNQNLGAIGPPGAKKLYQNPSQNDSSATTLDVNHPSVTNIPTVLDTNKPRDGKPPLNLIPTNQDISQSLPLHLVPITHQLAQSPPWYLVPITQWMAQSPPLYLVLITQWMAQTHPLKYTPIIQWMAQTPLLCLIPITQDVTCLHTVTEDENRPKLRNG